MEPVAIALLATLITATFLITTVLCLCIYLFFKLRASWMATEEVMEVADGQAPPPQPIAEAMPFSKDLAERTTWLSDASNPDWRSDGCAALRLNLSAVGPFGTCPGNYRLYTSDENSVRHILEELGYNGGVDFPDIILMLENSSTALEMADHIINNIFLQRLSLECEPEESLLLFTPQVHRWLRSFSQSLEGMTYYISKIPFQLAEEYVKQHASGWEGIRTPIWLVKQDVFQKVSNLLSEFFAPAVDMTYWTKRRNEEGVEMLLGPYPTSDEHICDAVIFQLRMITSPERFRYKWGNKTKRDGTLVDSAPGLYAYAGPDGVLLDEPKIVLKPCSRELIRKPMGKPVEGNYAKPSQEATEERGGDNFQ
ncbi:hypothetical protein B0O99DRAFT_691498 [Bisporella sp. PMI_857]|nr:hypothetical protein B0O99DRAFT_691498 [Bisporella sp. PMI_857]